MQTGPNFKARANTIVRRIDDYGNLIAWQDRTKTIHTAMVHVTENPSAIRHLISAQTYDEAAITGGRLVIFVFKPEDYVRYKEPGSWGSLLFYPYDPSSNGPFQQWTVTPPRTEMAGGVVQYVCILGTAQGNM